MRTLHLLTAALLIGVPVAAAAQSHEPQRASIQAAVGPLVTFDGTVQSLTVGYSPTSRITVLFGGERHQIPSTINRYENGYSASRGGTLTLGTAEVRFNLLPQARVSPYVLAGGGIGTSRPNVNATFPDPVTPHAARMLFLGGGVRVPLVRHLSAVADARLALALESDAPIFLAPIRAGIAWQF